jgi:hypothetical protein
VSTTTATTARATTTTVGADGAMIATTTASAAGHRPMCQDTMGTPTPACGLKTTGSHATPVERPTTSSSSKTCRSTSATLRARGSNTCHATRSTSGPTCVESSSATSRARTCALASNGSCVTASSSRGRVFASIFQALHQAPRRNRQRRHLGVLERHDMRLPHPATRAPHASHGP